MAGCGCNGFRIAAEPAGRPGDEPADLEVVEPRVEPATSPRDASEMLRRALVDERYAVRTPEARRALIAERIPNQRRAGAALNVTRPGSPEPGRCPLPMTNRRAGRDHRTPRLRQDQGSVA